VVPSTWFYSLDNHSDVQEGRGEEGAGIGSGYPKLMGYVTVLVLSSKKQPPTGNNVKFEQKKRCGRGGKKIKRRENMKVLYMSCTSREKKEHCRLRMKWKKRGGTEEKDRKR